MSHVSVRQGRAPHTKPVAGQFDPHALTEREADELRRRCMKSIDEHLQSGKAGAWMFKVRDQNAQLHFLLNRNGHLERFWLRLVRDNTLVIVGCRRGLFPLTVEPIHG